MKEIEELKRKGLTINAISKLTGYNRKTVRKYLSKLQAAPVYGPRDARASKLDPFKTYINERLRVGVWNGRVLLRKLRQQGYSGGYTSLMDWLRPQRRCLLKRAWIKNWEPCCGWTKKRSVSWVGCT